MNNTGVASVVLATGLLTLMRFAARLPWHPDGLGAVLDAFCEEHDSWATRLDPRPPAARGQGQTPAPQFELLARTRA